ncbi:MAG TPA: PilZ domain-containing protein [Pirellulales bacterium]|nr:PilZ domain-containing protein [Pirellulales bacterium]
MPSTPAPSSQRNWQSIVREIMDEIEPAVERRAAVRKPFLCATTIGVGDGGLLRKPAYIRDISEKGIGLVHTTPVNLGEITVDLPLGDQTVQMRVHIRWGGRTGDWYRSGGEFVDVVD